MNNKDLVALLAQRIGSTQQNTQKMLLTLTESLLSEVEQNESVQVQGFGTFEVKKRMERILVNPSSGKKMLVPPKLVLSFKPAFAWKESWQKGGDADE